MLILNRKPEQSIHIGSNIVIKILEVDGDRIKIGIDAPSDVQILRSELLAEALEINRISADTNNSLLKQILGNVKGITQK